MFLLARSDHDGSWFKYFLTWLSNLILIQSILAIICVPFLRVTLATTKRRITLHDGGRNGTNTPLVTITFPFSGNVFCSTHIESRIWLSTGCGQILFPSLTPIVFFQAPSRLKLDRMLFILVTSSRVVFGNIFLPFALHMGLSHPHCLILLYRVVHH